MKRIVFVHEGVREPETDAERNQREAYDAVIRAFARTLDHGHPRRTDEYKISHLEWGGVSECCGHGLVDVLVFMSGERRDDAERLKEIHPEIRFVVLTAEDPGDRSIVVANKLWKIGPEGWWSVILGE